MGGFQSQKLISRLILSLENARPGGVRISAVVERVAAEDGIFVGDAMVQPSGNEVLIRRAERAVVVFRDALHGIYNRPIRQRPESVHKRPDCRSGGRSHRGGGYQVC